MSKHLVPGEQLHDFKLPDDSGTACSSFRAMASWS
jgi:hypothetical protein